MQAEVNGLPCGDKERLVSIASGVETGEIRSDVEEAIRDAIEFQSPEDRSVVMNLPPRFFTVLALMQLGFVAGGFLITRAALRFYYHVDKTLLLPIPFPARLVNEFGLLMLLVPGILYAAALLRRDKTSSVTSAEFLVGITVTVVVGLSFSLGALSAVLRPLISLYGGGPHVVN